MTLPRSFALSCLLALAACGDDSMSPAPSDAALAGDAGPALTPDGSTINADAALQGDGGVASQAIPLVLWVDDLVDRHSDEMSLPDTVHDKNIFDDENPATFEKYFPK